MEIWFIAAQALGFIRLLIAIYTLQRKKMENIIALECTLNLLAAIERALLGSLAGECGQNNLSAARTGAALKRCQLTVAVGLREFAAQTAGES